MQEFQVEKMNLVDSWVFQAVLASKTEDEEGEVVELRKR
jgi:hypothetical protein